MSVSSSYKKFSFRILLVFILLITAGFLVYACKPKTYQNKKESKEFSTESLVQINKYLVEKDAREIRDYCIRENLRMKESKTGLFYSIRGENQGNSPREDQLVRIEYTLRLLDGSFIDADTSGNYSFRMMKSEVPIGLQEGVGLMKKGNSALLILPPHLGKGLAGDGINIPPRSTLVYEVVLVDIIRD